MTDTIGRVDRQFGPSTTLSLYQILVVDIRRVLLIANRR